MKINVVSRLARKKFARKVPVKRAREKHMWKLKSQVLGYIWQVLHETGHLVRYSRNSLPRGF